MSNGEVTISFDGINLDNCLMQGLELTGNAICPHCKLPYTFRIQLNKKEQENKYTETMVEGKPVTKRVPDNYDVSIEFVRRQQETADVSAPAAAPEDPDMEPCQPCNRCTQNCPKLGY